VYVRRSKDGAVPVGHEKIVAVIETVRTCLYDSVSHRPVLYSLIRLGHTSTEALLALLELF